MAWAYSTTTNATGIASISGTTLTFASAPVGTVAAGQIVTGTGVAANTVISFGSGLSWQLTVSQTVASTAITCSTKILTATGGTQGSPNSFAAGVLAVQTADATAGFQRNRYNQLTNVRVDVAQSAWVRWDDLNTFEFAGSSRYNPAAESSLNANNGGSTIVGTEVQCILNTSIGYNDANCLIVNTGGTLITLRSPSGINPLFIQQTSSRNDFPTFPTGFNPAVINIAGLTVRNNGASRKIYFGLARTVTAASNFNFETTSGEYQTAYTTYTGFAAPVASHSGDSSPGTASFYNSSWGTEQTGTQNFLITASGRSINYLNYDPQFPKITWSGTYTAAANAFDNVAGGRFAATMYSHTPTFKSGSTNLSNVVVQWLGTQTTGTTVYTIANISESLNKNATTTSTGKVTNYLLSAMIGREGAVNPGTSNKYQWSCKARAYGYISAEQYVWQNRSFLSDGVNGPLVEDVQLLTVANLSLTQAEAAALTGISLVASGTNGGVVTLTSNHTASEVWAYYRNWISTLANFNSNDTWSFDGSTLTIGGWTLVGLEYLTSGNLVTSTATATAAFTADVIGNVLQATPTNLTGVVITGNLTYNTNTPISVTYTDGNVTGTISNSGSALVKVFKAGTTPWLTGGTNVNILANVNVTTPGGLALSTYILKNGSTDLGWVAQDVARTLEIQETDTFSIYAIAYGYKAVLQSATASNLNTFQFELIPEPFIDTSLSTAIRDFVASKFSTALDAFNRIALSLDTDLRYYTPAEVMNAIEWYIVTEGDLIAQGVVYAGSIDGVSIINGGILISTPGFYGKVNDSVTTTSALGILVPIFIDVDPAVYVIDPTYLPVQKNSSGIVLQTAPWTKQTADISAVDKADIRAGLALEATLLSKASQTSVNAIPAATIAAMNIDPPDVNVATMNNAPVLGTGAPDDLWRG